MEAQVYPIQEASVILGTTTQALRRLCNHGLIPHVRRNEKGQRCFQQWQLELARTLLGMKQAGFEQSTMRRYSRLFRQGDTTLAERKAILTTRKRQLWQELEERQKAIDFIERQEEVIEQKLQSGEDHAAEQ